MAASILTANYAEAAALQLLGRDLPPVHSGHNDYWDWGPPTEGSRVAIVVAGAPIEVCRGVPDSWVEVWPSFATSTDGSRTFPGAPGRGIVRRVSDGRANPRPADGRHAWRRVREACATALVGGEAPLRLLFAAMLAGGHALIEDVPGTGKTTLARSFARALGLSFARVQGTPDLLPGDVTGSSVYEAGAFRFIPGPVFANILLVDEINRATPRTQSALLEAMQERQVSVDGETRILPDPFVVVATENPIELEGTFALPEAQLDRFLVRVSVGYPSVDEERSIAALYRDGAVPLDSVATVLSPGEVDALRAATTRIRISEDVERYLVAIVRASREHADVHLGASPRASVALYRASQAWALLEGRDFVIPDDVVAIAPAVLGHRLILDVDRELRGATAERVVSEILAATPVPMPEAS